MSYDKTLPSIQTKIRDYPTVLTANFAAIEEGDITLKHWQVNFIERNAVPGAPPPANDPTRADDTMIIFSKQDGSGDTELFLLDDRNPANTIQLSQDGKLGSTSTGIYLDSLSFDGTLSLNENNLITAWSYTQASGTQNGSFGMTCARIANATYEYTFTQAMANTNYCIVALARNTSGSGNIQLMQEEQSFTRTTTKFRITGVNQNNTNVTTGVIHNVMVVGGRA